MQTKIHIVWEADAEFEDFVGCILRKFEADMTVEQQVVAVESQTAGFHTAVAGSWCNLAVVPGVASVQKVEHNAAVEVDTV